MKKNVGRWTGMTQAERRAERRRMLVRSAIRVYGAEGFKNAGVRTICRDAGLSARYFYESFDSGEALLLAAFQQLIDGLQARIAEADVDGGAPDLRARAMLSSYFSALRENPVATKVFLVEIVGIDLVIDEAFEASLLELSRPMLDVFDPHLSGPVARSALLHRAVAGGLLHIALAWGRHDYRQDLEEVIEAALALCRLARPTRT